MSIAAISNSQTSSIIKKQFADSLLKIWRRDSNPRIGLAISGGVDSMALASLCNSLTPSAKDKHPPFTFTGFIVDHGLRKTSRVEAQSVAHELRRLEIDSRILTLDWSSFGGDATRVPNFESVARDLRYRAIGTACRDQGIQALLVAHHADDRGEGVLLRMLGKYYGSGLRGMQFDARIPSTNGVYGVCSSGRPMKQEEAVDGEVMLVEGGGVTVSRPLLPFTKEQLIRVCEQSGTKWFEDATNADRGLTARNTVRYLQSNEMLPGALRRERLLTMAERTLDRFTGTESAAEAALDQLKIRLDVRLGCLHIAMDDSHPLFGSEIPPERSYAIKAALLRRLLFLVCPVEDINVTGLHEAIHYVFDRSLAGSEVPTAAQVAGCSIQRHAVANRTQVAIQRRPPTRQEARKVLSIGAKSSDPTWHLWDNRYWIWIRHAESDSQIAVRFLESRDVASIRRSAPEHIRQHLNQALAGVTQSTRPTIPAIITTSKRGAEIVEEVVVLPSLNWSAEGWGRENRSGDQRQSGGSQWDMRYKHVDLRETADHTMVCTLPRTNPP